jgi:hypothetical protein
MTDTWVPGPPPAPTQPPTGLPPTDTWVDAEPCSTDSSGGLTSIIDNITITGAPGAITSVQNDQALWSIVLNDGTSSADFRIDRYQSGVKVDSPVTIARADGTVTFADPVMLGEDPSASDQAATKHYVDVSLPVASTATPLMDGTAAVGIGTTWARGDHVHPTDTSRAAVSALSSYLPLAGGTMTGPLTMTPNSGLNGAAGTARSLTSKTSGSPRWELDLGNTTAESGTATGSDFTLTRYDNTGTYIDSPLGIARATGVATFAQDIVVGTGYAGDAFCSLNAKAGNYGGITAYVGWNQRWTLGLQGNPAETGSGNAGSDFLIQNYTDAGAQIGTALAIKRSSGVATFSAIPIAPTAAPGTNTTQLATTAFVSAALSGSVAGVSSFNTRTGAVTLTSTDVTGALTFTPYNVTNPAGYVTSAQAASAAPVQSVAGRTGAVTLTHIDITDWTATLAPYALTANVPVASSTTPLMDGTAAIGTGTTWARADHVHQTDTSRYAASNPSGYQTAAQVTASLAPYAPLASPALSGVPTVPTAAPATATTQAASTAFVAAATAALPVAMNDNRILNGNFAINQRGQVSGTALAAAAYGHDRWKAGASGCTYTFTAALPDTTITITANTLTQIIEAGMIEGGVYTLSWTGTAQARVYQGSPTGSYAASPVITASLPAGVNTIVEFNTGTVVRAKFEAGTIATPFNRQSLAKSMLDCQRYYQSNTGLTSGGYGGVSGSVWTAYMLPVQMRTSPTVVFVNVSYGNASGLVVYTVNATSLNTQFVITAAGQGYASFGVTLTAEL